MKVRNVKADSLADVFTDSTLSAFTQSALNKGVTNDSIIYITCDSGDSDTFGSQFITGSNWIWAKGELFNGSMDPDVTIDETLDLLDVIGDAVVITGTWNPSATNEYKHAIISGNVELNGKTDCYSLTFASGAHLTINAGARLRVWEGGITNNDAESIDYMTIKIYGTNVTFGEFLLHPDVTVNRHPKAQVELYSQGYHDSELGKDIYQRFGVPSYDTTLTLIDIERGAPSAYQKITTDRWVEVMYDDWDDEYLVPFTTYAVTCNASAPGTIYKFSCNLVGNENAMLPLTSTWNYFNNSLLAKIKTSLLFDYLKSVKSNQQLYVYDYITNTFVKITENVNSYIEPCIGAFTTNVASSGTITLNYKDLIWDPSFEEEIVPTRSGAKGGSSLSKSEIPDEPAFKDPESHVEFEESLTK